MGTLIVLHLALLSMNSLNQTGTVVSPLLLYFLLPEDHITRIYITNSYVGSRLYHISKILNSAKICNTKTGAFCYAQNMAKMFSWYKVNVQTLTLSTLNKLSSAKFIVCFNFQSASMLLKVGENVFWVSNSLDKDNTASCSTSHPDPSCLHMALQVCLASYGLESKLIWQ